MDGYQFFNGVMWEVGFIVNEVLGQVPGTFGGRAEV